MENNLIYKWYLPWTRVRSLVIYTFIFLLGLSGIKAQNITKFEYFFDSDPGYGAGATVTVTPAPDITNLNLNVNIAPLSAGFHKLFFRAMDDSNRWSHNQGMIFYKLVISNPDMEVAGAEYFFETDPGYGNGVNIPLTPDTNINNLGFNINISSLADGFHNLYVRVRDNYGAWSLNNKVFFFKNTFVASLPNMVKMEYFLDSDPGVGNGTDIPVTADSNLNNISYTVDLSAVNNGFHKIYVRAKDANGNWSMPHYRSFYKELSVITLPNIVKAEYYFDLDPGYGSGEDIPIAPDTNMTNIQFTADLTALSYGFHRIFLRVKDADGRWSQVYAYSFYRQTEEVDLPDVVKLEYYLDSDPGFGNGNDIPVTPGTDLTSVDYTFSITGLADGFHYISVRAKNSQGRWSLNSYRNFFKETYNIVLPKVKTIEYFIDTDPGFGYGESLLPPADSTNVTILYDINIASLGTGFHKLFTRAKDGAGKWSQTNSRPFFKQVMNDTLPKIVKVEYFFDTDPGEGNAYNVPVTAGVQIPFLAFSLDLSSLAYGPHQLFVRVKDTRGAWSLTTHDTIFYYLDSLPTAMLNGPPGVCINTPAEFQVTLTGTAPWTLIYDTGEEIDTVANIMTSPYFFTVTPGTAGPHIAKVLKVQDALYTGYYTGVPIEYEVFPLPDAAGTISGSTDICKGTSGAYYWVYPIANTTEYLWTVPPGATISSTWYGYGIYVNFPAGSSSGDVTVKGLNDCGQGAVSTFHVNVHSNPVAEAGNQIYVDYGGTDTLHGSATSGTGPYSYYWYPGYWLDNPYSQDPAVTPGSTITYTLYVTDVNGCQGTDTVTVHLGPSPGAMVSGILSYDNAVGSPMNNSQVYLKQGNTVVAQTTTGPSGDFTFTGLLGGWYEIAGSSTKQWGGVNSADALLILQQFMGMINLTGLKYTAADVNNSGFINAVDALLTASRFVGNINSFASGDWAFNNYSFYAYGVNTFTENLQAICYGDADGSYVPLAKLSPEVSLQITGELPVAPGEAIDIPVYADKTMETGAISLVLHYPGQTVIESVRLAKGSMTSTGQGLEDVLYTARNGELRISWYGISPLNLNADEPFLIIRARASGLNTENWTAEAGSSIADGHAVTISGAGISMPKLSMTHNGFLLGANYPDPFSHQTMIPFTVPADGKAILSIYNSLGQEIARPLDKDVQAGSMHVDFDASQLPQGIFYYKLRFEGKDGISQDTRRMIISR